MSEEETEAVEESPKASKLPMIIGLVLALVGGGGGFYASWSGLILSTESAEHEDEQETVKVTGPDVAYVEVDPLVISLRAPANSQHLKFRANLEVPSEAQEDVVKLLPRVVDVLNSYLRAIEPSDLDDPSALTRLRAQMLRRVQVVTGNGMVNDLLIMEFVLT
ncbi:MAG: flagellar basal body-associated FliL family protein [Sulfitobacter sp.]